MEPIEIMRWLACTMLFTVFMLASSSIYMYYCIKSGKKLNIILPIILMISITLIGMMPMVFIDYDITIDDYKSLPDKVIDRWSDKFNEEDKEPLTINNETEGNSTLRQTTYYKVIYHE